MKKQKNNSKPIGVWMDHSRAYLIEEGNITGKLPSIKAPKKPRRIFGEGSDGTHLGNHRSTNNEYHKHQQEQNVTHTYYKRLADTLKEYNNIFLFGPTTARNEFRNYLLKEKLLVGAKITSRASDYLTNNQMMEKVNRYFNSPSE